MKPARVLITGAGGFVGGALALGFAELGWRVLAMDRSFDEGPAHPLAPALLWVGKYLRLQQPSPLRRNDTRRPT